MSIPPPPADIAERQTATITFDRNVVVTASAGTGKTTLLVNRLLFAILCLPEPVPIGEMVALTFTNKAAGEIKARLRERLTACVAEGRHPIAEEIAGPISVIQPRAEAALRALDRCVIDTFHGFAATLLRRRPLEAGVDPRFREDDGLAFEEHFQEIWLAWLTVEIAADAPRRDVWHKVLGAVSLGTIREMAFALCAETIDLESLDHADGASEAIRAWLATCEQTADDLLAEHPENRKIEKQLRAAREVVQAMVGSPDTQVAESVRIALISLGSDVSGAKGWDDAAVDQARAVVKVAHRLSAVHPEIVRAICGLLTPFVHRCRRTFIERGWMSFDGLLARARNLLRDHPAVRREVKRRYSTILVDELQDTDPIQYEILSYMAEAAEDEAAHWRQVRLAAGKLFVVGDPKQSIYAFRGADISAYQDLVDRMLAQGGVHCRLTTHFRSHPALVSAINALAAPLIQPIDRLQPAYDPLVASAHCGDPLPFRDLSIHPAPVDDDADAETARRMEAAALAEWLASDVIGRATIRDRTGALVLVRPGDVTILMRALTSVHFYAEALRRAGIPCGVEGDKHLFSAQEVMDAVNLLRVVADPTDRAALVGLLRSPVGGLTDATLWHLHQNDLLDDRAVGEVGDARDLYDLLQRLRDVATRRPAAEALQRIFEATPMIVLAAGGEDGPTAVARIQRLQRMAMEMDGTFQARVAWLARRVIDHDDAPQTTSQDSETDAVSLMTIHKAKGLEFPVVVLAGCHGALKSESQKGQAHVWRSATDGLTGLRVGGLWDLAGVYLADLESRRGAEEEKRVLYVALTRAREHLALSFCTTSRQPTSSYLAMFSDHLPEVGRARHDAPLPAVGRDPSHADHCSLTAVGRDASSLDVCPFPADEQERPPVPSISATQGTDKIDPFDLDAYLERWGRRRAAPPPPPRFINPSAMLETTREGLPSPPELIRPPTLQEKARVNTRPTPRWETTVTATPPTDQGGWGGCLFAPERETAVTAGAASGTQVGTLAHQFLEQCDFRHDPSAQGEQLQQFLNRQPEADDAPTRETLTAIFATFFQSDIYRTLGQARILGREVPILMTQNENDPSGPIVDGRIDLIYEHDGDLFVADYKTDQHLTPDRYRHQAEIYTAAVQRGLRRTVTAFQLIWLRRGEVISIS